MTNSTKGSFKTYTFLTGAMLCWGLSFVWYKQALENFGPIALVLSRLIVSLPLLTLAALLLKRLKKVKREDLPIFLLMAFFEPFLYFMGESTGMQYVSSTVASILIATIPIFTAIMAFFFLNEKLTRINFVGMAISFIGVLAVIFSDRSNLQATYKGLLLIMVAVMAALGYGFLIKRIADKYNSLTIVTVQNFIGALYFLPVYFIFDHKEMVSKEWDFDMIKSMLYLAVFASTLAYLGFIQGLRNLGVAKATVFTNFVPVFTAIFAFLILGDKISGLMLSGIVLVVFGLMITQSTRKPKKGKPEKPIVNELY